VVRQSVIRRISSQCYLANAVGPRLDEKVSLRMRAALISLFAL